MDFIEAALVANEKIYTFLQDGSLKKEHYLSYDVGVGGDRSCGIDLMAEAIFVEHLLAFGEIHSEESGVIKSPKTGAKIVIDPIDGSDNILSKLPYYGTSIAYFEGEKCTIGIIANLANGDVFVKDKNGFRRGKLFSRDFVKVVPNDFSKVGIFERSYCSHIVHDALRKERIKYRSTGAFALSLAYAYDVSFVIYEGKMRTYDIEAGLFMCSELYTFCKENIFLVSKDKETFDRIIRLFIAN